MPVAAARTFVARYREIAREPIVYFELPGAQHAFEIFPSPRAAIVLGGVERFLAWILSRREATLETREPGEASAAATPRPDRERVAG